MCLRALLALGLVAALATGCDRTSTDATPDAPRLPSAGPPASAPEASTTPPTDSAAVASALPAPSSPIAPVGSAARTEDERNTIAVFEQASRSTVFVTEHRVVVDYFAGRVHEVPAGAGSGFVWDDLGHVVTNFHVVQSARSLTVTLLGDQTFEARVVGVEPRKDIAVLRIDAPKELLAPVRLPPPGEQLAVGQKTIAIGNPFGLEHTLTTGIVSALGRSVQGAGGVSIRDMVQTDAAINPGNSGGPLLDSAGQLIGMNTMIYSKSGQSGGIGFAVPVATIRKVVPQLIAKGKVTQVGIGIRIDPAQTLERRYRIDGVAVLGVLEGGPADKAGLRGIRQEGRGIVLGDVIVAIDGAPVHDYDALYAAFDEKAPGQRAVIRVRRGREELDVPVALAEVE